MMTLFIVCLAFLVSAINGSGDFLHLARPNPTGFNFTICNAKQTIIDPARPSHSIPMLVYFPCDRTHTYPYMVFGHAAESQASWYPYIYKGMVPQGYIVMLLASYEYLGSETGFAQDQRYTNDWARDICNTDKNCPLYGIVGDRSIVSGMSMGGGAAMIAASNYKLTETFKYEFNALMTLSGCGGSCPRALPTDLIPTILMSGSHDCICPAAVDADKYYTDIPESTCKYLAVITNATHCHFGEEGAAEDKACEATESSGCGSISYQNNISEDYQHEIVINYMTLFMYATLYENSSQKSLDVVTQQLAADQTSGLMHNSESSC